MRLAKCVLPLLTLFAQGLRSVAIFTPGEAEAMGACAAAPDGVRCWGMDGRPIPELSESLRRALAHGVAHAEPGRKSRYLAVRHDSSFRPRYILNEGGSLQESYDLVRDGSGLDFVFISADPSSIWANLNVFTVFEGTEAGPVPFREGATISIGKARVEIGPWLRVKAPKGMAVLNPYSGHLALEPLWSIIIGLEGAGEGYISWRYTPFDAQGLAIRYVDSHGHPITEAKARTLRPDIGIATGQLDEPSFPRGAKALLAFQAYLIASGPSPAFRATTNIDPRAIRRLTIRPNYTEGRSLGPFPLDPASS